MIRQFEAGTEGAVAAFLDGATLVNRWLVAFFGNLGQVPSETLPYWSLWTQSRSRGAEHARILAVVAHCFHNAAAYVAAGEDFDPSELEHLLEEELLPEKLVGDRLALSRWERRAPGIFSRASGREELVVLGLSPGEALPGLIPAGGFRPAEKSDMPCLRELERLYSRERGEEDPETDLESLIAAGLVFVFEEEGEVAGVIRSNLPDRQFIHIGGVYVPPKWRGRGIATKLLAGLCERIHRGGKAAILDAGRSNRAALAAYRKVGFRELGAGLQLRFSEEAWSGTG